MTLTARRPRRGGRDPSGEEHAPTLALLVVEAAGLLAGIAAAEVRAVAAAPPTDPGDPAAAAVDLGLRFGSAPARGPWIAWRRADKRRWVRVDEVRTVASYRLRDLVPLPARVGRATPFWAAAASDDEIVLLLDPARL